MRLEYDIVVVDCKLKRGRRDEKSFFPTGLNQNWYHNAYQNANFMSVRLCNFYSKIGEIIDACRRCLPTVIVDVRKCGNV